MKIAIPKERRPHEARVAATPETVKRLIGLGAEVSVETGAGTAANILDSAYSDAGAAIAADEAAAITGADIVLKVQRPMTPSEGLDELALISEGTMLVSLLDPFGARDAVDAYAAKNISAFALELMPRITRAQTMDVLSSQSNLAGYKAVLDATEYFGRMFPMMMTAAGRINPARVFVMGAGVAGLQAIATAKRLGAIVSATDVRPVAKEQVESLGGEFVMVESEETAEAETAGGYAKEMSEDYQRRQAELVAEHIKNQDIVITTALIPGRPAPKLISEEMVRSMRPGSVIVDLAVEQGGNVALSQPGAVVDVDGVHIIGHLNVPSRLATDASALYARNVLNFLEPLIDKETKALAIDWEDEIIRGTCLTRGGKVVHPALLPEPEPEPEPAGTPEGDASASTAPQVVGGTEAGGEPDSAGGTAPKASLDPVVVAAPAIGPTGPAIPRAETSFNPAPGLSQPAQATGPISSSATNNQGGAANGAAGGMAPGYIYDK